MLHSKKRLLKGADSKQPEGKKGQRDQEECQLSTKEEQEWCIKK